MKLGDQGTKESSLLQEVTEMQVYIDNLTEQLHRGKQQAREIDTIKEDCYKRIESLQQK